jgi:DNA-binding transcriptional MocR family regulator
VKNNILKIDLDVKVPQEWLEKWFETRKIMLETLGYSVDRINWVETQKGYHVWIHLKNEVDFDTIELLQFLCGDDPKRVFFTLQRHIHTNDRQDFNLLFNFKIQISE